MGEASIVIRTKNEAGWLPVTLGAIRQQRIRPREVVIVDSGSTDATAAIVRAHGLPLLRIAPESFTFGSALNLGIRETTGDFVVSLSAHAVPSDEGWLSELLRPFEEPRVAGVYGRQMPQRDAYPPVTREYLEFYGTTAKLQRHPDEHIFSNANSAIRRSIWLTFPFDQTLPGGEDIFWAKMVLDAGHWIAYAPSGAVYHSHNETLKQVYARALREEAAWQRVEPRRVLGLRSTWLAWRWNTAQDVRFIRQHGLSSSWVLRTALFRLAQCLGRLRPYLLHRRGTSLSRERSES